MEGRPNRPVLRRAVPPAVLELFSHQARDHIVDTLLEVDAERDSHAVDAGLDLSTEERLPRVLPPAVLPYAGHRSPHRVAVRVDTEVVESHQAVSGSGPGLSLGRLIMPGPGFPRGEQRTTGPEPVVALQCQHPCTPSFAG